MSDKGCGPMNLIRLNNIQKTFGGTLLFEHVSFEINDDDKVVIIGKNGVGKSTLFKIILGEISPDSGEIFISRQARIGYLSQDVLSRTDLTLYDEMLVVFKEVISLGEKLHEVMDLMTRDHSDRVLRKYSSLEELFRQKGGYEYQTLIDMMLSRFGFSKADYLRFVSSFSGGEKTRIAFAKLLLMKPDVLLLDEPTNHMDIEIIEWLEDYLKKYQGAVVVITHDKYFINKVVTKIFEIDQETLEKYTGTYEMYEIEKEKRYELLLKQFTKQQKEISHLQSFVDRFRYKASKAKSAQDRIKKIERIDRIEKPAKSNRRVTVAFGNKRPTEAEILEIKDLSIGYDIPLLDHISFSMRGFEKIGIIGPNGVGKSTFVKTLLGEVDPIKGGILFHKQLKIGYFDQLVTENRLSGVLLNVIHDLYPKKSLLEVRNILAHFLFIGDDVFKEISILSGGELVRLRLLMLMLERPEFLVLDEPTNHLDIDTKSIVEDVFEEYDGPMIFISHDRYFINKVATKILAFANDSWTMFDGNYDEYKLMLEEQKAEPQRKNRRQKPINQAKEIERLEKQIDEISVQVADLKTSLFSPEIYEDKIRYLKTAEKITALEKESEILLEKMDEFSTQTPE